MLRDLHHISAHDNGELIVRAPVIDRQLNIREIYDMQTDRAGVGSDLLREIHDLLLRTLRGIGRRVEICRVQRDTALRDHPARDRRIDPAGQKEHCLAGRPDRHAARSRNDLRINIDLIADLNVKKDLRIMDVDLHRRIGHEDRLSELRIHLHGRQRIFLVHTSRLHLECGCASRMLFADVGYDIGAQLFDIFFFVNDDRANSHDPEDMLQDIDRLVKIPVPSAIDINSPARLRDVKISVDARKERADPLCERILKKMTVVSLDADLAVFDQK